MTPTIDSWLQDFEDVAITGPSPGATSQGSTASSFVDLGSTARRSNGGNIDGECEGGAKRAHLFLFDSVQAQGGKLCLGYVGSGNKRFCIKPVIATDQRGIATCGVSKHTSKFQPIPDTFYPRGNDTCAHCVPAFPTALVPNDQWDSIMTAKHTTTEWSVIFKRFKDESPSANDGDKPSSAVDTNILLKTPAKTKPTQDDDLFSEFYYYTPSGIKTVQEAKSLGAWWLDDSLPLPADMVQFFKAVRSFMLDFEAWWKTPISDLSDVLNSTSDDLVTLKQSCETLHLMIGTPVNINNIDFPDLWSAIDYLGSTLSQQADLIDGAHLMQLTSALTNDIATCKEAIQQIPTVHTNLSILRNEFLTLQDTVTRHDHRFNAILPLLHQLKNLPGIVSTLSAAFNNANGSLPTGRISPSFAPQPHLGRSSPSFVPPRYAPPSVTSPDLEARFASLVLRVDNVEKRMIGDGITISSFVFQTQDDVRLWCETNLPTNRFGLFLDGVSIFEFLAQEHSDATEVLTNLYNAQKNNFSNMYDSKVLSSCQNLFPTIFGRSNSEGLDTARTLPGLSTPDKWDNNGVTGLRFQLARELINVDTQLSSAINTAFRDLPEANALAKELLYRSKKFVNELSNFMSQDYSFWRAKGYDKKGSWELTCCSVRRLFEDIHQVRVIARDVRDLDDPASTAALILWATLRSHKVMEDYSRRNFYEHPSISAVIARHLAANHTKPDDALETKLRKLEDKVSDQTRRLDSLESRLSRLEKAPKNEGTPPKGGRGKQPLRNAPDGN